MEVGDFNEKLNKLDGKIYTVEEEVILTNGVYIGMLKHDNVNKDSLNIYTGSMLTGDKIRNYFLSTPSETPWKYSIKVVAPNVEKVYISYETIGDKVEAEDINNVQNEIVRTQKELNAEIDRAKNIEEALTNNLNSEINRATNAENAIENTINTNKPIWDDKYTRNETDNKISALVTSLDWKEAVNTFTDLTTTYPNAEDGWTTNTKDTDITYRYDGGSWIPISANSIPLATPSIDGKMSKQDKIDHDDMNNKKHTHENKSILDAITQNLLDMWNAAYSHISDIVKHITSDERTLWNTVTKKLEVTNIKAGDNISIIPDGNNITIKSLSPVTPSDSTLFETASGTGNAITLTLGTLANGYSKTFIASANNGGTATTINGKNVYKPCTTTPPNFVKDKAYTIWYNLASDCFFIKASAEGNTIASHVLAGDGFSNDSDTGLIGTMPNNGAVTINPSTTNKTIPLGYHNGSGVVSGDSNLVAANIKAGKTIFGVAGSSTVVDTADAVLDPAFLVQGYSGYDDGVKKNGTMINRSNENWHQPASNACVSSANGYGAYVMPPAGYYNGSSWVRSLQPDLFAQNIIAGKTICGIGGQARRSGAYTFPSINTGTTNINLNEGFNINVCFASFSYAGNFYLIGWVAGKAFQYSTNGSKSIIDSNPYISVSGSTGLIKLYEFGSFVTDVTCYTYE